MDEDEARAAAEARRQRILETADKRMDRVNGFLADDTVGTTSEDATGADQPPAAAVATGGKKTSKLAAMRRRRFRKNAEAASAGTTATTTESADKESEQGTKDETSPPAAESKEVTKEEASPEPVEQTEETKPVSAAATESSSDASTKKYVGVARMRRKMIKERQQKKQQVEEEEEEEMAPTAVPTKLATPPKSTYAIVMHLVTVLFLFLAGFEVGLQQNVIEYRDDLTIHHTLAPQQELRLLNQEVSLSYFSPTPTIVKGSANTDQEPPTPYVEDDEFASKEEKDSDKEENLDPLFGVDLDELTAGPGLFMMMGRIAVRVHRFLLSLVYYFPIRMWNNILALIASPPILCLTAIAIRQGSHLLGGKLPEATVDDAKTSTQHQDVMASVKNVVSNFILKSFPTATKIYEAWTHLRSDMYVVWCGLFVGLVWHHYLSVPTLQEGDSANDEL